MLLNGGDSLSYSQHNCVYSSEHTSQNIIPIFSGHEICEKGHVFGPHIRDYYLVHCCIKGKGTISDKHGTSKVEAGQLFIIRPGEVTKYFADNEDPWEYTWLSFKGDGARVFDTDKTVYNCPTELITKLCNYAVSGETAPEIYISIIYEMIYLLFSNKHPEQSKIASLKSYIDHSYMESIDISALAKEYGYERSYLYRLFKKNYKMGIKDYISKIKMENAKTFLEKGIFVNTVATMVGYKDEFNFSKAFKKYYGVSPSKMRKKKK